MRCPTLDEAEVLEVELPDSGALSLAEFAALEFEAALERELDSAEFDFQPNEPAPIPEPAPEPTPMPATPVATLQPGFMPLEKRLAQAVGLDAGLPITVEEFFELVMFKNGLPARYISPKKEVRKFIWDKVLKRKEQRKAA